MFVLITIAGLWGCVSQLPALSDPTDVTESLVVG